MKALVKAKAERGLWLKDVPEPEMGINDVLIKKSTSLLMNAKERVLKGETSIDEYERLNDVIKEMLD